MGTRHVVLVWYKGKWQIAQYGQWDGYPTGQGLIIAEFLINERKVDEYLEVLPIDLSKINVDNIQALKSALDDTRIYTPTAEELEKFSAEGQKLADDANELSYSKGTYNVDTYRTLEATYHLKVAQYRPLSILYPSVSRDTGSKILDVVAYSAGKIPLVLTPEEVMDGLYIEWAYVVDLDDELLEIYKGLEDFDSDSPKGRFDDEVFVESSDGSRPFLKQMYSFDTLAELGAEGLASEMEALNARSDEDDD